MEKVCRTCMTKSVALVDIFIDHRQPSLATMLRECVASIQIEMNDELPQKICLSCICDIQTAFAFKRRCEKSHQVLSTTLEKTKIIEETIKLEMPDEVKMNTYVLLSTEYVLEEDQDNYNADDQSKSTPTNLEVIPEQSPSDEEEANLQSELLVAENWEMAESDINIGIIKLDDASNVEQQKQSAFIAEAAKVCNEDQPEDANSNIAEQQQTPAKETKKVQVLLCPHCPKTFTQRCHLNSHIRIHTGERPYQCIHCPKAFTQASNLRKHMCIHSGERPFKCPHCTRTFTRHTDLQYHVTTHPGKQAYKCKNCTRYFVQESELEEHMRYHNGERTYKCQQCPKEYAFSWQLQRHVRAHLEEQPFKCPQCPKACVSKEDLAKHLRSHTVLRPHKCEICQKSFSRASYLRHHINTHTEST